jgi:hypothetical protein
VKLAAVKGFDILDRGVETITHGPHGHEVCIPLTPADKCSPQRTPGAAAAAAATNQTPKDRMTFDDPT